MGDVDVFYECSENDTYLIKKKVSPESVDLVVYTSCNNNLVNKKVFFNAVGRLSPDGVFCILTNKETLSKTYEMAKDFPNTISYFITDYEVIPIVVFSKSIISLPKVSHYKIVSDFEDIPRCIMNLSTFGSIVLCIGKDAGTYSCVAKTLGRYVISFGEEFFDEIENQGIRRIDCYD